MQGLRPMPDVGNSKVPGKNREGIAEDEKATITANSLLDRGQVWQAQKTWPRLDGGGIDSGSCADDPGGIALEKRNKALRCHLTLPQCLQACITGAQLRPGRLLPGQQGKGQFRKGNPAVPVKVYDDPVFT